MSSRFALLAIPALLGGIAAANAAEGGGDADAAHEVPVTRVALYSAGVGYFEHHGAVQGDASVELQFTTEQINDVLKSLIVLDRGGSVAGVAYPSQDPLNRLLGSFAIDLSGDPSLESLLRQLRGAQVRIVLPGDRELVGAIVALEARPQAVADTVYEETVLTVATAEGLQTVALREIRSLRLVSEHLQGELDKALAALAEARNTEKKTVSIRFKGEGQRAVALGYVVETPVWKTSYRLLLADEPQQPAHLQGWAIVENQTEHDWLDVELNLISGRPISFIEALYDPIYIARPVVEAERYASLRPTTYGAGLEEEAVARDFAKDKGRGEGAAAAAPAAPRAQLGRANRMEMQTGDELRRGVLQDGEAMQQSVQSLAQAEELGALFRYQVADVDLARRRSAMLPIITDAIEATPLSIYNQATLAKHPLRGARLKNTTGKHLLQGPITIVDDGAYAGDARIEDLPPDQERLISYAVDLDVSVVNEDPGTRSELLTGIIADGVLRLQHRYRQSQVYVFANADDEARALLVEHPRLAGWELVDSPTPVETTDELYRFQDELKANESIKLGVHQERLSWEAVALVHTDVERLLFFAGNQRLPEAVRQAVAKAAELQRGIVQLQQQIQQRRQQVQEITQEQNRIRSNMGSVDRNSSYYNRLLKKLDEQETSLETLGKEIERLEAQALEQRRALAQYLSGLNVGR